MKYLVEIHLQVYFKGAGTPVNLKHILKCAYEASSVLSN